MTDLEIARSVAHKHIFEVAQGLGIHSDDLLPFGRYKAKISLDFAERIHNRPLGRYILVTAINPTPLGEGKTVHGPRSVRKDATNKAHARVERE